MDDHDDLPTVTVHVSDAAIGIALVSKAIARKIVPIVCFIGAAVVACTGNDGWGWLILAGIVTD